MLAPFISATVLSAVVPFSASSGVQLSFLGDAHEQRQFHDEQTVQLVQERVVLFECLAEAEARVEYDVLLSEVAQLLHFLCEGE